MFPTDARLIGRFAELRVLVNEWDPLDLTKTRAPEDEYDCLVAPLLGRLEAHTSVHEIAAFLDQAMREYFGVPCVQLSLGFAIKAQDWYAARWPDPAHPPPPAPNPNDPWDKWRRLAEGYMPPSKPESHPDGLVRLPSIERARIGPIVIGMKTEEIVNFFPPSHRELVDLSDVDEYDFDIAPALRLRFMGRSQRDGVVAILASGSSRLRVWSIAIKDPAFRTAKGVGVGSTVGELREAYQLGWSWTAPPLRPPECINVRVKELCATFDIDQTGLGEEQLRQIRTPADLTESLTITAVHLTRDWGF
jgi:hypothetical protein